MKMVVNSQKMRDVQKLAERVACSPVPVMIQGETGTGKELVARAIHDNSDRADKPFVAVNCAAIPETLFESTIFGYERGAFTGAEKTTAGLFERAQQGTVFLDEIGELSASAQAALLRVTETSGFHRVGGNRELISRARIITATHRNIDSMTEQGSFRRDLFYRLNILVVEVPPLRERTEDIESLARYFLCQIRQQWHRPGLDIHPDAIGSMLQYPWPGNVRELRNAIERAALICPDDVIRLADLPKSVRDRSLDMATIGDGDGLKRIVSHDESESIYPQDIKDDAPPCPAEDMTVSYKDRVRAYEIAMITEALKRTKGKRKQAAALLRLPLRTLTHKLKAYELRAVATGFGG